MKEKSEYKSVAEWRKHCPSDYKSANKRGFIDLVCERFGWEKEGKNYF